MNKTGARAGLGGWVLYALLLGLGAAHWVLFFGVPPALPREAEDWPKEFRYYAILRQAVTEGRIPYFISQPIQETRKFFALPETVLSPQIVLLRYLSIDAFFVAHVVLLYALGLAACFALRRRYQLSLPAFALLWLLLSFNGHITSHLAIGHSMWGGYFLLPAFFLFVLQLVEAPPAGSAPIAIGVTLGVMLLQGSYHVFVWCVLYLLLLLAFDRPSRGEVLKALGWSLGLGLFRLVPAAVILLGRRVQAFETGFPSVQDLLAGLLVVRDVTFPRRGGGSMGGLRWWEFDTYIGIVALIWLIVFGVIALLATSKPRRRLALPMLAMTALSMDGLFRPFSALKIPLISSERVSSRMLILPLGLLVVVATVATEEWLRRGRSGRRIAVAALALSTALLLGRHSYVWSVPIVAPLLQPPPHARDLGIEIVAPRESGEKGADHTEACA